MMSACALLPAAVFGSRTSPLESAGLSPQAGGGVRDRRACCVRGGVASSALASSRLQHQQRQSELKHLRHAIAPSAPTPRSTTVVRATAAPGGDSGSAKTFAGASKPEDLFDREYELDQLDKLCSNPPKGISVIHGPRNCGKTRVLTAFVKRRGLEGTRSYIDCRDTPMRTPSEMADALLKLPLPAAVVSSLSQKATEELAQKNIFPAKLLRQILDKVSITSKLAWFSLSINALVNRLFGEPSLQSVLDAYNALLDAWETARDEGTLKELAIPVLVIDEANVIMDWSGEQHTKDLKALVDFLVSNTKQKERCHVILATSDSAFISWMLQNVGAEYYQSYAIGEFTEGEARGFISYRLQVAKTNAPSDVEWSFIYNACGGNAGVLRNAAIDYVQSGSWHIAVQSALQDIRTKVQRGYTPNDAGYERKHFKTAVTAILNSTYMAVNAEQLLREIPPKAFDALIAANLLSIRCSSEWARDVDPLAFDSEKGAAMVVTALNSAHLAVWRQRALKAPPADTPST